MDLDSFRAAAQRARGSVIDNKYEVLAGLGYGTFGTVFLGFERLKKRFVALKRVVVSRDDLQAVTAEMEGMEVLADSPSVVQYLGYAIEEPPVSGPDALMPGQLYVHLIMEFGGVSLEPYLHRFGAEAYRADRDESFGRRNEMWTIQVAREALAGLRDAHERRIVHRDIKPANIYLGLDGRVRLGDFGVAKQLMHEGPAAGTIVGTVFYMAPEQIAGEDYGLNIDLFSMGVVLYRMLAGKMPFANMVQIRTKEPDLAVPGIFPGMREIIARALAKDPRKRYASAQEMINDLEDYEVGLEPVGLDALIATFRENIRALLADDVRERLEHPPSGTIEPGALQRETTAPMKPPASTDQATVFAPPPPPKPAPTPAGQPADEGTRIAPPSRKPLPVAPPLRSPLPSPVPPSPPSFRPTPPPRPRMPEPETPLAAPRASRKTGPIVVGIAAVIAVLALGIVAALLWPRTINLRIYVDQPAKVVLNGVEVGTVPADGPFVAKVPKNREQVVRLSAKGFEDLEKKVPAGRDILEVKMTPLPEPLSLSINLNLRDVVLKVGNRVIPGAPVEKEGRYVWKIADVVPGAYAIEATAPGSGYQPAATSVTLDAGKSQEVRLDLVASQAARVVLTVTDATGKPIKRFDAAIDGVAVAVGDEGAVTREFKTGDRFALSVTARGLAPWSREVIVDAAETRVVAALEALKTAPEPRTVAPPKPAVEPGPRTEPVAREHPRPAPGTVRITASPAGYAFVNWIECGRTPATCKVPAGRSVEVFVFDYARKVAWEDTYTAGKVPTTIEARMSACRRDVVLDWKPWAYVEISDHRGAKVRLPVSAVEGKPQTPKRIAGLACGGYRVLFSDESKVLSREWQWVRPRDPKTVRVGKF
jgi:serine/threonine protein kinase